MSITKAPFGVVDGKEMTLITLTNSGGMSISATNYGANVVSIKTADKNGNFDDIIIGYGDAEGYKTGTASHGAMVGRYANRIAGGKFTLNGTEYSLALNDGGVNCLHGGNVGYNKRVWEIAETNDGDEPSVTFAYTDPDGEENFPGKVDVKVTYTVTEDNSFKITYYAVSDKDTVINLTNHAYYNLSGYASGNVYDQWLKINSAEYTPTDETLIPTGEIASVKGTVLDFTEYRKIGEGLEGEYAELEYQNGYDHNFILGTPGEMRLAAEAKDDKSGRTMALYTDMPAVQLYTGNFLDSTEIGKDSKPIEFRTGFCLETQFTPNSPNLGDEFPSCVLKAGNEYKSTTIYKFGVL